MCGGGRHFATGRKCHTQQLRDFCMCVCWGMGAGRGNLDIVLRPVCGLFTFHFIIENTVNDVKILNAVAVVVSMRGGKILCQGPPNVFHNCQGTSLHNCSMFAAMHGFASQGHATRLRKV